MSETPRTDAELPVYHGFPSTVSREFARTLERELSAQEVQMNAVRYRAEKAERELAAAQSDLAKWIEAFGLVSTIAGEMLIDVSDPLGMAREVEATVARQATALKADLARLAQSNAELREALQQIVARYDAYRRRGVNPAPTEYAQVVEAIDAARRALSNEGE